MGTQLEYYEFMGYSSDELKRRYLAYAERFAPGSSVLDIGCGRGEFLTLLKERGVHGQGIDQDEAMVAYGRERGLTVDAAEANEYLAAHQDAFDGIFASHLIEHLTAEAMQALVRSAVTALRPGGRLLLVTPNPHNLNIHLYEFWTDLQHVRFYTPEIMRWVLHEAGLHDVEAGENPAYRSGPGVPDPAQVFAQENGAANRAPSRVLVRLRLRARVRQRLAEWLTPASLLERMGELEGRADILAATTTALLGQLSDQAAALYPAGEFFVTGVR